MVLLQNDYKNTLVGVLRTKIRYTSHSGDVALEKNSEPGYNTLLLRLIPGDFYVHVPIDISTHYPAF